jgi:hypothetical protein
LALKSAFSWATSAFTVSATLATSTFSAGLAQAASVAASRAQAKVLAMWRWVMGAPSMIADRPPSPNSGQPLPG